MKIIVEAVPKEARDYFKQGIRDISPLCDAKVKDTTATVIYNEPYIMEEADIIDKGLAKQQIYAFITTFRNYCFEHNIN